MQYARCQAVEAEALAQAMFRRVLTGWAMDLLALRRSGLDRPGPRSGSAMRALAPEQGMHDGPAFAESRESLGRVRS